jgi:DNA-binding CsgD family transcriptional regulator
MSIINKSKKELLRVYEMGYRIDDDGMVRNPSNNIIYMDAHHSKGSLPYYRFKLASKRPNVMVHRLCAYQQYKDAMFEPGIMVRHLNGDSLDNRPVNIAIGTAKDNANDVPKKKRLKSKLTPYRKEIVELYNKGYIYSDIAKRYDTHPSNIRWICLHYKEDELE